MNSMVIQLRRKVCFLIFILALNFNFLAMAQQSVSAKNKSPFPVKYLSLADQNILLRTITLAPVYDNLNGIYAQPIQKLLIDLLQTDKAWGYADIVGHDQNKFIENYDLNPNDVIEVLSKTKAHGLLTAFITKGPRGLNAKLKLFSHSDGLLVAEESVEDYNAFEIPKLRLQFVQMYQNLKNKLPYRGYVLSRRGVDVTISLGSINGVKEGQELTLAQIIKLNRHPKLKTIVGVEKEIIAKVVVKKVDAYLCFAQIVFEKETGVVDVGSKVLPSENISYPMPQLNSDGAVIGEAQSNLKNVTPQLAEESQKKNQKDESNNNEDSSVTQNREALFDRHNSMGSLTAQLAITQYTESNSLTNGTEGSASQSFAPGVLLGAQVYFWNDLFAKITYQTNSFSSSNGLAGSTPYNLSINLNQLKTSFGYDYVFESDDEDSEAIKFTGLLGLSSYQTSVDNSSPVALTSITATAMVLGFEASMPVSKNMPLTFGGRFDLTFSPTLSESPVNSGNSSTTITSFGFFGVYKMSDNYNLRGDFTLTNINNHFRGGSPTRTIPAGSGKIETTTEQFGIEYLF